MRPMVIAQATSPVRMPRLIYGTAWKKERTQQLVAEALRAGFRGIDTACQPKHYFEPGVGAALAEVAKEVPRETIFLQTKFTPIGGQDLNQPLPYNQSAPLRQQVMESFATSQKNLGVPTLDSLVLHSPLQQLDQTLEVWRAFEELHGQKKVGMLGISNCYDLRTFEALYEAAAVKPSVLQNRFYPDSGYDRKLREYCKAKGVTYQSFWTLTGNRAVLASRAVQDAARRHGRTPEQVFFAFVKKLGIVPLTGTTSAQHMREDLDVAEHPPPLSEEEVQAIDKELSKAANQASSRRAW